MRVSDSVRSPSISSVSASISKRKASVRALVRLDSSEALEPD